MRLSSPFFISSRLLPAIKIGNATISIAHEGEYSPDNREIWHWYVDIVDTDTHGNQHTLEYTAADLKTGCGASSDPQAMMATLLAFMGACADSLSYRARTGRGGDNADLFPLGMHEWLTSNSDEIYTMQYELEENMESESAQRYVSAY